MPSRLTAVLLSTHPGPTVVVTTITVGLGIAVGLPLPSLVLLGAVMLLDQASVGLSNDWIDADRDRRSQRADKPIARGWVSKRVIRSLAFACAGASILLSFALGAPAAAAHLAVIAPAWAYNAGLKNSALSVVPYVVTFGMLPLFVTSVIPAPAAAWAIAAGALLGVAAHFANVLPDLDDDRATGISGLPHRLGRRMSGVLTFVILAGATVVAVAGAGLATVPLGWIGIGIGAGISAIGIGMVLTRPPARSLFRLIILAALVAVSLLLASGASVTG